MNHEKQHKFNGTLRFGISDLSNVALLENFYPEDLPADWRISYYANEFELLVVHLSDLTACSLLKEQSNNELYECIIEQLIELKDDIETAVFCIFDCSGLPQTIQQQLVASPVMIAENIFFIDTHEQEDASVSRHSTQLECVSVVNGQNNSTVSRDLFCHIKSELEIDPLDLRKLLEHIRDYACVNTVRSMNIAFSSHYALKNCRNAILLDSMM